MCNRNCCKRRNNNSCQGICYIEEGLRDIIRGRICEGQRDIREGICDIEETLKDICEVLNDSCKK